MYFNNKKVDACSLKTHPPFTFLNWTDNGKRLQCVQLDLHAKPTIDTTNSTPTTISTTTTP